MEDTPDESGDELQRRVLQNTLDEVAARSEDGADCCVICLDSITEPCEAFPCHHQNFDYLCVSNWLFETPKCPLCKATVTKVVHGLPSSPITTFFNEKSQSNVAAAINSSRHGTGARAPRYLSRGRGSCRGSFRQPERYRREATASDAIQFRRDVYRNNRYSKHVGSNRVSRYRELTPRMFNDDTELVSRARMWIRRELRVFAFLGPDEDENTNPDAAPPASSSSSTRRSVTSLRRANNAEFLLEYIIAVLKSVDIMGSAGQAEDMLSDFLGRENTKLFLHELRAWLRSPFSKLEDWDRAVQYNESSAGIPTRGDASRNIYNGGGNNAHERWRGGRGDFYRPRNDRPERYSPRPGHGRRRSASPGR